MFRLRPERYSFFEYDAYDVIVRHNPTSSSVNAGSISLKTPQLRTTPAFGSYQPEL